LTLFLEWGKGERRIKENSEGVPSSIIYLIYCKNFCKCHNVPLPSTTIKKGEKNRKKKEVELTQYMIK
jgi:hypothetical protein